MSAEIERKCGTCRHWTAWVVNIDIGECSAPYPINFVDEHTTSMLINEGGDCEGWESK